VQEAYAEVNVKDAARLGIQDRSMIWVHGASDNSRAHLRVHVSERTGPGVVFIPFHFGGIIAGQSKRDRYPPGLDPVVLGEAVNQLTTYGYDAVTHMQETKVTLCRIEAG